MTIKTVSHTLLSLAFSVSLAFTAANAAGDSFVLDESIHDYSSYDSSKNSQASSSRKDWSGYNVKTVIDESYYDYYDAEFAAFELKDSAVKRADFAAFLRYDNKW